VTARINEPDKPSQRQGLEDILTQGYTLVVLVDALSEGVALPMDWLQAGDHLIDNRFVPLSIGLSLSIPDFSITEVGWSGTLTFPDMDFYCFVPWEANRQYVTEDRIVIWKLPELSPTDDSTNTAPPRKRPSHLRVIK
jgi:hypothetical protein